MEQKTTTPAGLGDGLTVGKQPGRRHGPPPAHPSAGRTAPPPMDPSRRAVAYRRQTGRPRPTDAPHNLRAYLAQFTPRQAKRARQKMKVGAPL